MPDRPYVYPYVYPGQGYQRGGSAVKPPGAAAACMSDLPAIECREWFQCEFSNCEPSCSANGSGVEYSCDETKCTAKQPDYLNQEKVNSAWSLIDSVVPAIGGKGSITFEVSCVVDPAAHTSAVLSCCR